MRDLKSMTLEEMTEALKAMGQPAFRGKQVFTWLHKGVTSFDDQPAQGPAGQAEN